MTDVTAVRVEAVTSLGEATAKVHDTVPIRPSALSGSRAVALASATTCGWPPLTTPSIAVRYCLAEAAPGLSKGVPLVIRGTFAIEASNASTPAAYGARRAGGPGGRR